MTHATAAARLVHEAAGAGGVDVGARRTARSAGWARPRSAGSRGAAAVRWGVAMAATDDEESECQRPTCQDRAVPHAPSTMTPGASIVNCKNLTPSQLFSNDHDYFQA